MAASVVLNGARSNTRVSDVTRRRIIAVASELNYSANAMAQGLKRQRSNTIGILFSWAGPSTLHSSFSMAVLDGIVAGAATKGYRILLYTEHWEDAATSTKVFSDSQTDGVVLVAPYENSDVVPSFLAMNVPVVLLSSATTLPNMDFVHLDDRHGVFLALEHLHELGHSRIAYVGSGHQRYSIRKRYDSYCDWMSQHSLSIQDDYIIKELDDGSNTERVNRLAEWLQQPNPPTAVFTVTDDIAAEVLEAARSVGIRVPEEMSVVGFDDSVVASLAVPKLTTIHYPVFEMSQQATHLLIESMERKREGIQKHEGHIISPTLVVRESTAPVRKTDMPHDVRSSHLRRIA